MLEFLLYFLAIAAIYGMLALSLNLQAGVSGLLNFGQVAFFGIGAYAIGITALAGGHWILGFLVGQVLAVPFGLLLGRIGRTLSADYWAIVTLAGAETLRLFVTNQTDLTGGPQGIGGIAGPFDLLPEGAQGVAWLVLCIGVLAVSYLVAERLTGLQFGRVLRLIREQPHVAESLGYNVTRKKMVVLAVSGAMAAAAGSLYTLYISFIGPGQLLPIETFLVFTMLILGGMGNNKGAVLGALVVQLLYTAARFLKDVLPIPDDSASSIRILIVGLVLVAFLLWRPDGLLAERPRRIRAPN